MKLWTQIRGPFIPTEFTISSLFLKHKLRCLFLPEGDGFSQTTPTDQWQRGVMAKYFFKHLNMKGNVTFEVRVNAVLVVCSE